jgi:glutamate-5-semialdehyde dehydrogenase
VDAAALCVKAGNAVVLRGGSEAIRSNLALADELRAAAGETGIPVDAIGIVSRTDRSAVDALLRADEFVDLIIPRGGSGLIRKVIETSTIPVIKHDAGVCHVFIDASADRGMATAIVRDSKIRQVAVCNGLETLLVHADASHTVMPGVLEALHEEGVEIRGCERTCKICSEAIPALATDWNEEYLDKILAVRVVDDLDEAIAHIRRHGSDHTEVIVTNDYSTARRPLRTATASASARRSVFPPRSCTRTAPWASRASPPSSSFSPGTVRFANEPARRNRHSRGNVQSHSPRPLAGRRGGQ